MSPRKTEASLALDVPVDEDGIPILTEVVAPGSGAEERAEEPPEPASVTNDLQPLLERLTEDLILELVDEYRRSLRAVLDDAVDQATDQALERLQQRLQGLVAEQIRNSAKDR